MQVRINDNIFNVKTLIDRKSKSIGMMGKRFDSTFDGLLFLMGGDKQSFWMKNTLINLDMVFLNKNYYIIGFYKNAKAESVNIINAPDNTTMVLELNGGLVDKLKIKIGDKYIISNK